ncbi:MAG: hypothetical protein QMC21_07095 [Flavobacteriales bacterium]
MTRFQYQNLTVWGEIETWYLDTTIVKIRAIQIPELGFTETIHFFENG